MIQIIKNNWTYIAGAIAGAIGGYLYWKYVGCSTGTCPITSSPLSSSIYGILLGTLFGGIFKKTKNNNPKES